MKEIENTKRIARIVIEERGIAYVRGATNPTEIVFFTDILSYNPSWPYNGQTLNKSRNLFPGFSLVADLDGTTLTYDYRARPLAYVITFDYAHAHNFHLRHPRVSYECRGSNLHDKIRREVMTHASRARW